MSTEPKWLRHSHTHLGLREAPGSRNNPTIMSWAKTLGVKILGIVYNADSTPWCGVYVGHCIHQAGIMPPKIAVRAKAWASWGQYVTPRVGSILVFNRSGGGHVGFYVGEDATHYHVEGGNQGDCVSVTRIPKVRLLSSRWPLGVPISTAKKMVNAQGVEETRGEA